MKFRSSLFGFNKEDVLSFVTASKESENSYKIKQAELESKLAELEEKHTAAAEELTAASARLTELEAQLAQYKEREESLKRISESIGKLYLVAQANASAIINNAKENAELSTELVAKNVEAAESAETEFTLISNIVTEKSKAFTDAIDALKQNLAGLKARIAENVEQIAENGAELEEIGVSAASGASE